MVTDIAQAVNDAPVSVVIPCYRCGGTIHRAVASLSRQTKMPAEVILVDDASGDGTLKELHALKNEYPAGWIKISSLLKNSGPGVARNLGIGQATQPYIAFLDADDTWHPQKLSFQYEWMYAHPEVMLTGHPSVRYSVLAESIEYLANCQGKAITPFRLLISNVFSSRSIMFRRELPVMFDAHKRYMEDHWWLLEIVFSGYSVAELDMPMAFTYKADYGEGGLSNRLWQMERSELDNYLRLGRAGKISMLLVYLFWAYSLVKYARRLVISQWRRFF